MERDPFGDDIVTSPRSIERAVDTLNSKALSRIEAALAAVEAAPLPRLAREQSALLVLSPDPGYGKSHLVGRLFQLLDDRATQLYLRPFQDSSSVWVSLLEKTVQELDHPDAAHKLQPDPGENTQLDTLARQLLSTFLVRLLEDESVDHPDRVGALELVRKYPSMALESPEWRRWLSSEQPKILVALDALLQRHGVSLRPSRKAWLKVLLAYAYGEDDPERRQLCLDWLTYSPLDDTEGKRLGLRKAELPENDLPYEQRNERCFERLADLFTIGAFYRPFLLCFDQTELYGSPELARAFGVAVSRLRRETCNHLLVVTANSKVWDNNLLPYFEDADSHAFDSRPVELAGMSRTEAKELLLARLARWEVEDDVEAFCESVLTRAFRQYERRSVRDVIREARRLWSREEEPDPAKTFESYRLKLLAAPRSLDFDAGVLQWAVETILGPCLGREVRRFRSPRGYFTVEWDDGRNRRELFGFEAGRQWKRWEAILREAGRYRADAREGVHLRCTQFRLPRQKPLSERTRTQLENPDGGMRLVTLNEHQAADLFAAHDFFADVRQGNHDFTEEEVLDFLRGQLRGLANDLWGGTTQRPVPEPNGDLYGLVADIVRRKRFVTVQVLLTALKAEQGVTAESVVKACAGSTDIKIHISPSGKVFQWVR